MVVVKVELWPGGDESKKRDLGRIDIINDNTGTAEYGNYDANLWHAGRFWGKSGSWRRGRVTRFHRRIMSPYHLVMYALKSALGG